MRKIVDYTDDSREAIIAEQEALGFILIEDQRHLDGNHLVFDDQKPLEPLRNLAAEIDDMKARIEKLESR